MRNGGKDTEYGLGQKQRKLPLLDPTSCLSLVSCTPYLSPPTKTETGRLKADCRSGECQNQHSLCSYSQGFRDPTVSVGMMRALSRW